MKEVLEELGSFSDREFDALYSETTTHSAFEPSDERCARLAQQTNRDAGYLTYLFALLKFLYQEISDKAKDDTSSKALISELISSLEIGSDPASGIHGDALTERLIKLLAHNENAERRDKIGRLKRGFLHNANGFSSFVDLRPNYSADRSKILDLIPVVQFRISAQAEEDDDETYIFQLDEFALQKLKDAVDDAEKKLTSIRSDTALADKLAR